MLDDSLTCVLLFPDLKTWNRALQSLILPIIIVFEIVTFETLFLLSIQSTRKELMVHFKQYGHINK